MIPSAILSPAVENADREVTRLTRSLEVLLEVTPVNADEQWDRWVRARREPEFTYRPLEVDLDCFQQGLNRVDLGGVEDPALHRLLSDKLEELHLQAEMVRHRGTARFLTNSIELHGGCSDDLLTLATELLMNLEEERPGVERASPEEYVARAEVELSRYRTSLPGFRGTVELRADIPSLMVVGRVLFVGVDSWLPRHRVEALVHHEVGTHLLTAETGGRQPLQLLEHGTAGYEETQEALGVLSEYLVGGLDEERMRILAGRALAVHMLTGGASFTEVVDALAGHGLAQRSAWTVTMRVFRGGGFTKDVIYLRGLVELVNHLASEPIETLLVGKIHLRDVPLIEELLRSGLVSPPALMPHWLQVQGAPERLTELGQGGSASARIADWLRG
jgi:uncharacterized protein (TIGR02421 family)